MKIYTKTGDAGTTGLADMSRVRKSDPLIEAIGDVDELNAHIGIVIALWKDAWLERIQHELFDLGGELCLSGQTKITEALITELERNIDALDRDLPKLKNFILPGGSLVAAHLHATRTICRRAERRVEELNRFPLALKYLNRLSDLLFIMARWSNQSTRHYDVLWNPRTK